MVARLPRLRKLKISFGGRFAYLVAGKATRSTAETLISEPTNQSYLDLGARVKEYIVCQKPGAPLHELEIHINDHAMPPHDWKIRQLTLHYTWNSHGDERGQHCAYGTFVSEGGSYVMKFITP